MNFWPTPSTLYEYFEMGGFVMWPLVAVSIMLWYALVYRGTTIRRTRHNPRELIRKAEKQELKATGTTAEAARLAVSFARHTASRKELKALINEEFGRIKAELGKYKGAVRSLVAVAPLLGLLGTVDGMIETFDSLADMALFTQSGGIAGGISKALFTTQMGLAISIPGLLIGRMIERKERDIAVELDQIRDLVCAKSNRK